MNRPSELSTKTLSNAPKQDLRTWIAQMEAANELQIVRGANREDEIGGIVDVYQRQTNNKAVLFDDIPGYPSGYRALANILTSTRRIRMTLGLPADASDMELIQWWRKYMKDVKTIPPVTVPTGLVLENVARDDDVNLLKIPAPRWHEHDGGYYIGTGDMVIMRHPDTGWINYGAYRVQVHDKRLATVMCSKGKHGNLIMRRYQELGQKCPIAVVCGMHPALFMIAGLEIPYGKNEYDAAGGLLGEAVETIPGPVTGLPIPANAEIAFEGYVSLDDVIDEGPLGEWTGYYAGGLKKEPAIRVESLMHRDNPVLLGAIPGVPPDDDSFYRCTYRSGAVWNQLEAAGVPEVKGVWSHETGGSRLWLNVSIKQMYAGHSKQAGLIASQCHAGAYANRFVVVVDDDIDPADMNKVMWAMCTRFDPREGLEILRGCWSTALDPMSYSPDDPRNARVVIDACKPFSRRDTFPMVVRNSAALDERIFAKFNDILPRGRRPMYETVAVTLNINGRDYRIRVEPRKTLVDAIREDCGKTGTHIGCEHGVCGTCTVILDGEAVRACLMFAVQAHGKKIRTVEGLGTPDKLHPLQRAFIEHHGLQCGFCTPGFLMLAVNMLEQKPDIGDQELLDVLSSNLCRCTGYQNIIKAVKAARDEMRAAKVKA